MTITITGDFRSTIVKKLKNAPRFKFIHLIIAAVISISSVLLTGCSSADGTDLEPRVEILATLRAKGFVFNKYVISTVYGENKNQVIVSGQLGKKTPDNTHVTNGVKLTQHRRIVVENTSGQWEVMSAPQIHRDQFTSRDRWSNK